MAKVPVGAELIFSRDENIKAKVVNLTDSRHSIEFNGGETSLSDSAQKILGYTYKVAGTLYWMYEGETLDARRTRFQNEGLLHSPSDEELRAPISTLLAEIAKLQEASGQEK